MDIELKTNYYFPNSLDVREIGYGKWQLLSDYVYIDEVHGKIVVPRGFVTDLYSIPHPLRIAVSRIQDSNGPAVIHDWLYRSQMFGPKGQREADKVLHRAMINHWSPVPKFNRGKIMAGLYIGGWTGYRKARKKYEKVCRETYPNVPTTEDIILSTY